MTSKSQNKNQKGFTLTETLIAVCLMTGAFMALAGAIPVAALVHRGALEREQALALAQYQMEFFLTNPGPLPGQTGNKSQFVNSAQFPPGFTGSFSANNLVAGGGLTLIVVGVNPPHTARVELSAIDTTFSNITP